MPVVSIIIPVYNAEKYLWDCLNSVSQQLFSDFEVILVDDGSIDSSGKICDEYACIDSRFSSFLWYVALVAMGAFFLGPSLGEYEELL